MRNWLLFISFIITFSGQPSFGNQCDEWLNATVESSRAACVSYGRGFCADNSAQIAQNILNRLGPSGLKNAYIHYIFNKNFDYLKPVKTRNPNETWGYHAILETEFGISDLDSRDFLDENYKPIAKDKYFRLLFGSNLEKNLEKLLVVSVPAITVLRMAPPRTNRPSKPMQLAQEPIGWVQSRLSLSIKERAGVYIMPLMIGEAAYFILSAEAHLRYPPKPISVLLEK